MFVTRVRNKFFKKLILKSEVPDKQNDFIYEIYMYYKNDYILITKHILDLELRKMVKSCTQSFSILTLKCNNAC